MCHATGTGSRWGGSPFGREIQRTIAIVFGAVFVNLIVSNQIISLCITIWTISSHYSHLCTIFSHLIPMLSHYKVTTKSLCVCEAKSGLDLSGLTDGLEEAAKHWPFTRECLYCLWMFMNIYRYHLLILLYILHTYYTYSHVYICVMCIYVYTHTHTHIYIYIYIYII